MISRSINVASVSLALLSLAAGFAQQPGVAANSLLGGLAAGLTGGSSSSAASASSSGSGGLIGGLLGGGGGSSASASSSGSGGLIGGLLGGGGSSASSASSSGSGGLIGGLLGGGGSSASSASSSGSGGLVGNLLGGGGSSASSASSSGSGGLIGGLLGGGGSSSASASASGGGGGGSGLVPRLLNGVDSTMGQVLQPVVGALGAISAPLSSIVGQAGLGAGSLTEAVTGVTGPSGPGLGSNLRLLTGTVDGITTGLESGLAGVARANNIGAPQGVNPFLAGGWGLRNNFKRAALADSMMANGAAAAAGSEMLAGSAASAVASEAASGAALGSGLEMAGAAGAAAAGGALAAANVAANSGMIGPQVLGREALAVDAMRNAQAESALAGQEMVAHGVNNAHSASLASNAYRQAKLASARDRVNIAGTIQNSARISDAAIATHDAATKAEDSLLGSELAVDSAATVLDSDAAYIPPVTSSLLRSLPYGRLGIRNIIPKPLTYPSQYLPDVWLNGKPVNYLNVPLKMYPYGFGPAGPYSTINGAFGIYNGQPFLSNNGVILNGMVYDPAYAYALNSNVLGVAGSSVVPVLANGQLEAQDELAMANAVTMQQLNGAGMATTYQGYGRLNPVPMITGSVSDINLMPTTTIGTTYPIGSALVIEPRDSFFQDYNDNASSRQNMDERQQ